LDKEDRDYRDNNKKKKVKENNKREREKEIGKKEKNQKGGREQKREREEVRTRERWMDGEREKGTKKYIERK
jgi:hypothetical protein